MPSAFIYLGILLGIVVLWFAVLLTVTGTWGNVGGYIDSALSTSLLYSMTAFVALSIILTKTKIIDSCIALILSLLGRIPGGAGYAAILASSFMGALSGSGPGNVMATGVITIPAMKKSGFPAELAANVESNARCMGNMIPPSSNIVAALGAFTALYPATNLSTGQFWIVLWGISLWFIAQRVLTLFAFCKYYKIRPMDKADIPCFKESFRLGWQGLLLPVVILLPFVLDYLFKETFSRSVSARTAPSTSPAVCCCSFPAWRRCSPA